MPEILKTKNRFLIEDSLVVKSNAKAKDYGYFQDENGEYSKKYGLYSKEDTRHLKDEFEKQAAYFYIKLYRWHDKKQNIFVKPKKDLLIKRTKKQIEKELKQDGLLESRRKALKKSLANPMLQIQASSKYEDAFCWRKEYYSCFNFQVFKAFLKGKHSSIALVPIWKSHYYVTEPFKTSLT